MKFNRRNFLMNGAAASALASMGWYPNMARAAEGERICAICGDEIESYDEYQLDHINPHSEGGRTVIENGQLSHASYISHIHSFSTGVNVGHSYVLNILD